MSIANVLFLHHSGKNTRTINFKSVIKHLYLDISSFYSIISMRNSIYNKFCTNKLSILLLCNKNSVIAEISLFLHLVLYKRNCLFYLVKNSTFKNYIFDNIHIFSYQRLISLITDKTNECSRKKELRILTKK